MNIIEFLNSLGVEAKAKNQSEFYSPCPVCGGKDRFQSWPERNRWFCRGCDKSGDLIDLVRVCKGLSFHEACSFIGEPGKVAAVSTGKKKPVEGWQPKEPAQVSEIWRQKSENFVTWCHRQLMKTPDVLRWLQDSRGITADTARRFKLGWNPLSVFNQRSEWGIPEKIDPETGTAKKLFFPAGLVIPGRDSAGRLLMVKIRAEKVRPGQPKYYFLPGGVVAPSFYQPIIKDDKTSLIIVESELDAILLAQETSQGVTCISIGSAKNKPDTKCTEIFSRADRLLISLDNDQAGGNAAVLFWKKTFKNAKLWLVPSRFGKDHTEAFFNGLPLGLFVFAGISSAEKRSELTLKSHFA